MSATSILRHRPHLSPSGTSDEPSASHWLRTVACYCTIALLVFGPLAFGAVEAWSMYVLHIGAVAIFLLWLASVVVGRKPEITVQLVHLPPLLFACIVLYQILLNQSAYRHGTVTEFTNYIAYGLIFLISTDLFRNEREVRSLVLSLAVFGFALSLFAIIQDLTSDGKLYWLRTPENPAAIFGPYVNRNHYAGAMEMLFPFALIGALRPTLENAKRIVLAFAALLMLASVFLSGSRGGFLSIVLQMIFLGVLLFWRSRRVGLVLTVTLAFVVTGAFGTWLGSDRLIGKLGDMKNQQAGFGRVEIAKDSLKMLEQRPWTGWGLGNFPVVYPRFRTFATDLYVNEAHNDFVQLLTETGLLGFAVGLFFLAVVFRRGFRQLRRSDYTSWRTAALAASLGGIVGIVIHSLFDFNLQIPANAMLFYVLCGIAGSSSEPDADIVQRIERGGSSSVIDA